MYKLNASMWTIGSGPIGYCRKQRKAKQNTGDNYFQSAIFLFFLSPGSGSSFYQPETTPRSRFYTFKINPRNFKTLFQFSFIANRHFPTATLSECDILRFLLLCLNVQLLFFVIRFPFAAVSNFSNENKPNNFFNNFNGKRTKIQHNLSSIKR